jgi:hypothetical protein
MSIDRTPNLSEQHHKTVRRNLNNGERIPITRINTPRILGKVLDETEEALEKNVLLH